MGQIDFIIQNRENTKVYTFFIQGAGSTTRFLGLNQNFLQQSPADKKC